MQEDDGIGRHYFVQSKGDPGVIQQLILSLLPSGCFYLLLEHKL